MPTQSERVINNPLTGHEMADYLRKVFDQLLQNEGMLSPHVAYGKVWGDIKLTLRMENAYFPQEPSFVNFSVEDPAAPAGENDISQKTAEFEMDNPNAERVRLGLPVPVETKQLDGTKQIEHIHYPAEEVDDLPPKKVKVKDTTVQGKKELGL